MSKHRREHDPLEGAHPGLSKRAWQGEEAYVPLTMPEYIQQFERLVAGGATPTEAHAALGWIIAKWFTGADNASAPSRAKYRRMLASCDPLHGPEGGRRLRPVGAGVPDFLAGLDIAVTGALMADAHLHATGGLLLSHGTAHNLRVADYVKQLLELGVAA